MEPETYRVYLAEFDQEAEMDPELSGPTEEA